VVIKVTVKANTKGVCRLECAEKVLEITDVRKARESAREAGETRVCGCWGRLRSSPKRNLFELI